MAVLHQFVPSYLRGDAVGEHTRQLQALLHDHGVESIVYSFNIDPANGAQAAHPSDYRGGPALYQYAVGSDLADLVTARVDQLAVNSHNVTPPSFFAGWHQPAVLQAAEIGEAQLPDLARASSFGLAVSGFNEDGLRRAGFSCTARAPVLVDTAALVANPDLVALDRLLAAKAPGSASWLFTGRIVPNKAQHDVVKAFAIHRATIDPHARLYLVGRTDTPAYEGAVRRLVARLELDEAVELTGPVSREVLAAHYAAADVFVCLSEHEGFCVPLVEAMLTDVPIVAYRAAAVPETLGGAGLCLPTKQPVAVSEAVADVLDLPLRARLVEAGRRRAAELALEHTRLATWTALSGWLERLPPR